MVESLSLTQEIVGVRVERLFKMILFLSLNSLNSLKTFREYSIVLLFSLHSLACDTILISDGYGVISRQTYVFCNIIEVPHIIHQVNKELFTRYVFNVYKYHVDKFTRSLRLQTFGSIIFKDKN